MHPLSKKILAWFADHGRDLPWRRTYSPYHVWISEIMLQQTQMDRAVAYFERWVEQFPDVLSLAAADQDEILKQWEGLGYYSRARNLHRAAILLAQQHGGQLPAHRHHLLALPGIGPYTAGAILSIAFDQPEPVIDANVERLFARLFDIAEPVRAAATKKKILRLAEEMLAACSPRLFNQALMELGALVCTPRSPGCPACPVASHCRARKLDTVQQRPVLPPKKEPLVIEMATGIVRRNGLLLIQKRPATGVWANLWEFPGGRLEPGESPEEAVVREYQEETELTVVVDEKITTTRHSFMHYRVILHCFFCRSKDCRSPRLHAAQENRWVRPEELGNYAFPAGHRKLIDYLERNKLL